MAAFSKTLSMPKAQEPKAQEPKAPEPEAKVQDPQPKKVLLRAIHGRMVDQTTGEEYDQAPKLVERITNFVQCQIDAGKMEIVKV